MVAVLAIENIFMKPAQGKTQKKIGQQHKDNYRAGETFIFYEVF